MSNDINGFEKFNQQLSNMAKAAEELEGTKQFQLPELLTPDFMTRHTKYQSLEKFLNSLNVSGKEEFEALPQQKLEQYVRDTTDFDKWEDLVDKAVEEYAMKKLGFDA